MESGLEADRGRSLITPFRILIARTLVNGTCHAEVTEDQSDDLENPLVPE
jgi:hypothetical protein